MVRNLKGIISSEQAANMLQDESRIAVGGFLGYGCAEELLKAVRSRFDSTGHPKNLTLIKGVSIGDKKERGINRLAAEGLVRCIICAHFGLEPEMARLAAENKIFSYMLPLGTITDWFRAVASKSPGLITYTGIGTFVDPDVEGGKGNALTKQKGKDLVSAIEIKGKRCLYYETAPIHACIIRGTYADEDGNISMEKEAILADQMEIAAATYNSGGLVFVQVERIVKRGSIDPRNVKIHGFMVDYVVVASPENHTQSFISDLYQPELTGEIQLPLNQVEKMPMSLRKICGRRAAMELKKNSLVNLGIGMPDAVAAVAAEEGISSDFTLSIESGVLGGVPLGGLGLGASINPEAIYKMPDILNIYDGGGLDTAVLGLAEADEEGNLNVSKFNGKVMGPGGFIDITQNTPTVIFTGTFLAGNGTYKIDAGKLSIEKDASVVKFKKHVEQITFCGRLALERNQKVMLITERAVFHWTKDGWLLTEIAPGVDLEKDILAHMEFAPLISKELKTMDQKIFFDEPLGKECFFVRHHMTGKE